MDEAVRTQGTISATSELVELLRELGPVWNDNIQKHRDRIVQAYSPLVAKGSKGGVTVHADLAYGPHPRQVLDLFQPEDATAAPILVFVHGGAFTRGSKSRNGEIYDNVLHWFAQRGFVCANVEYRLAPEARYPEGARDVLQALSWIATHAGEFGGAAHEICVMGHSAGGAHVATGLWDPTLADAPRTAVAAVVLVSARLRADILPDNPNAGPVQAYFGTDPATMERHSPMQFADGVTEPLMIAVAEFENRYLDAYGLEFAAHVAMARGHAPTVLQVALHNHTSIVAHFNTGDDAFGTAILRFLNEKAGIVAPKAASL